MRVIKTVCQDVCDWCGAEEMLEMAEPEEALPFRPGGWIGATIAIGSTSKTTLSGTYCGVGCLTNAVTDKIRPDTRVDVVDRKD